MLDVLCSTLSDEAQLRLALTFGKLALPVWEDYFTKNPDALDKLNALIRDTIRVNGGLQKIDIGFPQRAIEKIERSLASAKEKSESSPIPLMKSDPTLSPLLATCMQPLTNKQWDNTLTQSVRLVFTLVFNILVWILYRRKNEERETHIYVAVNMGVDVMMRESIRSERNIHAILDEFRPFKRKDSEDDEWENALPVGRAESFSQEDIYRQIIGEKVIKGQGGTAVTKEVLRQMRDEGKSYWNMMDEYQTGTSTTYSYDKEKQSYKRHEFDVIVGSFSFDTLMTEEEMSYVMSQQALVDLRESGFEV